MFRRSRKNKQLKTTIDSLFPEPRIRTHSRKSFTMNEETRRDERPKSKTIDKDDPVSTEPIRSDDRIVAKGKVDEQSERDVRSEPRDGREEQRNDPILPCKIYDTTLLEAITHLIDIDGYYVDSYFFAKEIAVLNRATDVATRFDVRLPCELEDLNDRQRKQVLWTMETVHGIPWTNVMDTSGVKSARRLIEPTKVPRALFEYFVAEECNNVRPLLVAYKGGRLEVDMLSNLAIPSINLEIFGCRKYDFLVTNGIPLGPNGGEYDPSLASSARSVAGDPSTAFACDNHRGYNRSGSPFHCPVEECRIFARWVEHAIANA